MVDREHALAEVDNDGHWDRHFRLYRYVCRCGKAGPWVEGVVSARGGHDVHASDMRDARSAS